MASKSRRDVDSKENKKKGQKREIMEIRKKFPGMLFVFLESWLKVNIIQRLESIVWTIGNSRNSVLHWCRLWHPHQGWKFVILPWDFGNSIISMLKTCKPNLKSRAFTLKNICKINQHEVVVRNVSQRPTLTPFQWLRNFFCPRSF